MVSANNKEESTPATTTSNVSGTATGCSFVDQLQEELEQLTLHEKSNDLYQFSQVRPPFSQTRPLV